MNTKGRKWALIIGIVLLLAGLIAAVKLVKERQEIRKQAAVAGGRFHIALSPNSGELASSQTLPIAIKFSAEDPASNHIAAISLRLSYEFTDSAPSLKIEDADSEASGTQIELNQGLFDSDWNCPINKVETGENAVIIEMLCANVSGGYQAPEYSAGDTSTWATLATVTFEADPQGATPQTEFTLRFDPTESIVTRKADGQDFLAIPESPAATVSLRIGELPGDVNGDGRVDIQDLSRLLSKWEHPADLGNADLNGDGVVNVGDLSILLSNWTG
ncbi:dockerin type I domain-containing protein [Candidatus Parcubacteria bacterium]|nr:dockerin type I domain-containing protein [Candidatus Parcubacteria bacterium]